MSAGVHRSLIKFTLLLVGLWLVPTVRSALPPAPIPPRPAVVHPFRLGISAAVLSHVNENDARAAIGSFARQISLNHEVPPAPFPFLFKNIQQIRQLTAADRIDAIVLTLPELWAVRADLNVTDLCVANHDGQIAERFVVLVHRDSPIQNLADLAGKSLAVGSNARTVLAPFWLDLELARLQLPPTPDHVGSITEHTRSNRPALDVFFRRADACLVSERMQETVYELNPALRSNLRAIAVSPALMSTAIAFIRPSDSFVQAIAVREILQLQESPAGRQVLLLLRMQRVTREPVSALADSLALLDEHQRHRGAAPGILAPRLSSTPGPDEPAP